MCHSCPRRILNIYLLVCYVRHGWMSDDNSGVGSLPLHLHSFWGPTSGHQAFLPCWASGFWRSNSHHGSYSLLYTRLTPCAQGPQVVLFIYSLGDYFNTWKCWYCTQYITSLYSVLNMHHLKVNTILKQILTSFYKGKAERFPLKHTVKVDFWQLKE